MVVKYFGANPETDKYQIWIGWGKGGQFYHHSIPGLCLLHQMRPWQWQRAFTVHSHFEPHQKQNDRSTSIQSISSANAIRKMRKMREIIEWNSSRVCWGCIWPTVGSIEECFCWKINSFQFLDSCNAHRCVDFAKPILQLQPNWQDCNILDFFILQPHLFVCTTAIWKR